MLNSVLKVELPFSVSNVTMMKVFYNFVGLVLLTTLCLAQYNPLEDPIVCGAPICNVDDHAKFKYGPGKEQIYKYTVEVKSLFNGTSKNESSLFIEAKVTLGFLTPCDGLLSLSDIKLSENGPKHGKETVEHANSQKFADVLTDYSLRFAFKDGIVYELCPIQEEEEWSLNFKKGILSMLQNSMKRLDLDYALDEEDVRGKCPTTYKVSGMKETTLLIEKTKDLERCEGRSKLHSAIQSQAVPIYQANIHKDNILKSTSSCIISIDHNIYTQVSCKETYLLQPFSNYDQGAATTVSQNLVLIKEIATPTTDDRELTKRVPLTFNNVISTKPTTDDIDISKESLSLLCELDKMPDRMELADLFSKFIQSLRSLSYTGLAELYNHAGGVCSTGKHFLLHALPFINTVGSLSLMKDIIIDQSLPESTLNDLIATIGFIPNTDNEMMEVALSILQESNFSSNTALSISSLAHTFCNQHSDCESEYIIQSIGENFENNFKQLMEKDSIDSKATDEIMVTLKALSNIGVMSEDFVLELFKVIENSEIDIAIRVAAVETFRRSSCEQTRSYFEHIFRTQRVDPEVRIASYLQIMRCPNYIMMNSIKHMLTIEEVNQVGSFVWTHLTNLMESGWPSKVEVQSLLTDKNLVSKFDKDVRKFSRNFEGSMYFEEYNLGGNYESNVIFSTNSYVPKSAMLNLTVDLFGESFNILEIYGRVDGLEHYLESFFGPKGASQTLKDNIMDKLKWRRDTNNNALLKSQVDDIPNVMNNFAKEPKVALGCKIFGNEARYVTFNGDKEIKDGLQQLDPFTYLKKLLSGEEINYNKAAMFLDGKYIVSSGAGLPLSLTATGTASINIKLYGSLTSAEYSKDKEFELDLTADIQPTVSVDLTGEMSVDAFYASTGIKLKANLYSDSAVKGEVKVKGLNLVSVKFSLPREKNEIFVARSELLVKQNGKEEVQKGVAKKRISNNLCSWQVVDQTIGLKLCTSYNFENLTRLTNLPYMLMVGPANFRISLHKADPTATIYLFEYKWVQTPRSNVVSVTFDTPGSSVKRLIAANLTLDTQTQNVTMLIHSAAGTVVAYGRYKNTEEEKSVQIELDINNIRHFEASAALTRSSLRHGFSYKPHIYLGVNGERILSFSGSIETMSKKGVSQYSVKLKFETKRFTSMLYGYVLKGDTSIEGSLTNDYQFMGTRKHRVSFKFGMGDKSHKKNMEIYMAFLSILSSAYPNLNLNANATIHRSDNHKDLSFKLYQNPLPEDHPDAEDNTLKFETLTSHSILTDGRRKFKIDTSISRKSSNLGLKGEFTYETYRYDINSSVVVQYGWNKEVSMTVFWSRPRSNLEQIKTHVNITIPSFAPMTVALEIVEKQPKDYRIDFKGSWFSGHSMNAAASYQDKSGPLSSDHHVKLLLMSPHFKYITIDLQFYRDNDVLKFDLKGDMDKRLNYNYGIFFLIEKTSVNMTHHEAQLKYGAKLYSYVGSVYSGDYKKINAYIHFDQSRDIDFKVYLYNQPDDKAIEFDINWDSNRSASQKVMVTAMYKKNAAFDYIANFMVTYPGRGIKGDYKFLIDGKHFQTLASISWDVEKTFAVDLDVIYEYDTKVYMEVASALKTPFDNWKVTQIDGKFEHLNNMYTLNGKVSWEKRQKVQVEVFGDYTSLDKYFTCKYSCSVSSSVDKVPNVNATIGHMQNETNFDTIVNLMYNPDFVIGFDSKWKVDKNNEYTNLTGTVSSITPFKGFKTGFLISKVMIQNNYIRGAAKLDLDHKQVDLDMEGKFVRLTNCFLIVNATTARDSYQLRIILSTAKRHFVTMITYPNGGLGTELLVNINSITNFDVKLHVASPLEFIQDIILVARLQPEMADFRVGWNFLLLGFSGVWHYANVTDFDYSYKIYTPIEGFEENGIVAKLIFKEGLDFEVSIKFSNYKLGAKLLGQSKPKPLKELGIKLKDVYVRTKHTGTETTDDDDLLNWGGLIEIDVILYPTMKGELEIDQRGTTYILKSKLTMPHGIAEIYDELDYTDALTIHNELEIFTPYQNFRTITSNFDLNLQGEHMYVVGFMLDYMNRTELIQTGIYAKYIVETRDVSEIGPQERIYNVTLKVNTPFKALPKLNLFGAFETEENFYHTKLLFNTNRSDISVDATTEIDKGLFELTSRFYVITPAIHIPPCELRLSKLFSDVNNYVDVKIKMPEKLKTDIYSRVTWLIKSTKDFRGKVQLETPYSGLENTTAGLDVYISDLRSTVQLMTQINPIEIEMDATFADNVLTATSLLTFSGDKIPVIVNCSILQPSRFRRDFKGTLNFRNKLFKITGNADLTGMLPTEVAMKFTPEDNSPSVTFEYRISSTTLNRYELLGSIRHSTTFTNFNANLTTTSGQDNYQLDLKLLTSNDDTFIIHSTATIGERKSTLNIDAETPIPKLERPKLGVIYVYDGLQRDVEGFFKLTEASTDVKLNFIWNYMENMLIRAIGNFENKQYTSHSSIEAFYGNPGKAFRNLKVGADVKIDRLWEAGSNLTLDMSTESYKAIAAHMKIPDEHKETYSLWSNVDYKNGYSYIDYLLKYRTSYTQKKYGSWGKISTEDKQNLSGDIQVEWNGEHFNNFANLKRSKETVDLIYKLKTPKFIDKQLLVAEIMYKSLGDHHNLTCEAFYPEDLSVAYGTIDYKELANMNGMLRTIVPHKSFNYTGAYFTTKTNAMVYNRYIKVFWDGDDALLDSKCDIKTGPTLLDRHTTGKLIIELPLTTRHIALVDYDYDEKSKTSIGQATVNYNGNNVLEGKYNRLSESQAGKDKDTVHVEVQNDLVPVGADYVYKHEYKMPDDPTRDIRVIHLYNLKNQSKFNVSGELDILTKWSGQKYTLTAIHLNRIVKLLTDYEIFDRQYKQHSRLELSPIHWIEYDVNVFNKTADEKFDAQQAIINVIYPQRSFTAQGFYNISDSIVSTDMSLVYDDDNKTVKAGLDWRRASLHREQLLLQIKHPSFERDVTFSSEYGYDKSSIDGQLLVEYSLNPDQKLTLRGKVNDNSNSLTYNYTYNVWAEHIATNLDLNSRGDFYWNSNTFGTEHVTNYQRSYLPSSTSEMLAKVNLENNEIELKKDNIASGKSYFWGRYGGEYPVYTANMSAIYDTNDTKGEFYINFKKKMLYLNLNMTEDGTQSLHMVGSIPDVRSTLFDIWRDYDERRVSDVAYYLRLNHSRLITSQLKWRPELIGDVTTGIRSGLRRFYEDTLEAINNTKQYTKAETLDAINGIWTDAKPYLNNFLRDLRNITIIEADLEQLKIFLENVYNSNEFYIKDIISIITIVFDDLALKSRLQSLPKIVQEIWAVMGDSGVKIQRSILWVIEKIKTYYKNATDFVHNLFNGDPVENLSIGLEKLVEKYDAFIKSLHLAIIQYMENMWSQTYTLIVEYWRKTLAEIEPKFMKFIFNLESIAWSTGKEALDFLYLRKNELIESPYFIRITKVTQDLDKFYKDITGNNTIGSIYKYSKITWNLLKEKYLTMIPFGTETLNVVNEILEELQQIGEIPSMKFLIGKWWETYEYIKYYYDYFDVENRIHKLIHILYIKLSDMSMTALEIENRQRIPKTKFVFEPNDGIMLLEQKLPMSWHAFNETPNLKEIPEIRKIFEIRRYLEETEISFWNLYYDYRPYTDPSDWLPPFKGNAMLMGSKYYVTFDKKFYEFQGKCTYLLATDYVDKNFTLLVSYDDAGSNTELIMIVGKEIVRINILTGNVLVGESKNERLPMQIGETYLYKDAGIFRAESHLGFVLECNMKFRTCMFEISGWYFGKTAGLWGTYNNEPTDDFLTSNKTTATSSALKVFGDSWSLGKNCKNNIQEQRETTTTSQKILSLCEEFFTSRVSQLSTCFPRIPKDGFLYMCLNSTTEQEACMSAVSYINLCSYANTPLRIPDTCVKCNLLNGSEIQEGDFIRLQGSDVPHAADIVFIVEAKSCNSNLKKSRNFDLLVELIQKELEELNIKNNSYAVVTFGGDGVYDKPRSISIDGKIFTDARSILRYFDEIPTGDGNTDILNGIMFAYNLIFRPGVSRNFVLVPCSECNKTNMQHDYSTIHQLLTESAISMHILMNNHFTMQKEREVKVPFGIDRRFAYTKRDVKSVVGDQPLRKSIILPKFTLGLCMSLSLETNGTIYSAKFLETERKSARKFATVFAKTVARAATPSQCVDCECTAPNTGISYMECTLCTMANSTRFNFEILGLEEEELSLFDGFNL